MSVLRPPQWIINLQPGEYTMKELTKLTGLSQNGIAATIVKYGAGIKKVPCYRNLQMNIYIWNGYRMPTK